MGERMGDTDEVESLLRAVAAATTPAPPGSREGTFEWAVTGYRLDPKSSVPGPNGSRLVAGESLPDLERAVDLLAQRPEIAVRWETAELWALVASLVGEISSPGAEISLEAGLARMRTARSSVCLIPLANVAWTGAPMRLAGGFVGGLDEDILGVVHGEQHGAVLTLAALQAWRDDFVVDVVPVVAGVATLGHQAKAVDEVSRFAHSLLLAAALSTSASVFGGRCDSPRPGIRGDVLDRAAIDAAGVSAAGETTIRPHTVQRDIRLPQLIRWSE